MKSDTMIIDFTALPIQNGAYIVGAAMDFFHIDEEENCNYIPYRVASLYIDDKEVDSVSGCIKYALKQLIKEVPEGVKRVVIRSDLKQFIQNRCYREEIDGMIDAEIRIKCFHRLGNIRNQIQLLANDALNRKSSVIGEIE